MIGLELDLRKATPENLPQTLPLYGPPGLEDGRALDFAPARAIRASSVCYLKYRLFLTFVFGGALLDNHARLRMHNLARTGTPSAFVEDEVGNEKRCAQSIRRQLINHVMSIVREADCYQLALSPNIKRTRAHAFCEWLGFRRHGLSFLVQL